MRTSNTKCIICGKPLYRRPNELKKVRYVACMEHREEAKRLYPLTDKQLKALELGREKGTNHLEGIPKSQSQKDKIKIIIAKWCKENINKVKERGKKTRGEYHYQWKGGVSRLNMSIRRMTENRRWSKAVRERDGKCVMCGATENLDADHIIPLATLIKKYGIKNREDARNCSALWDINNGVTLCKRCHCKKDNRKYTPDGYGRRQKVAIC